MFSVSFRDVAVFRKELWRLNSHRLIMTCEVFKSFKFRFGNKKHSFFVSKCVLLYVQTFALWWILAAVSENIDLIDGSKRLKELPELLLGPGAWNLAHKHLNGVHIWLVGVVQRPIHLLSTTMTDISALDGGFTRQNVGKSPFAYAPFSVNS